MITVTMPGKSYDGALPSLSPEQTQLRNDLRGHVAFLAGTIGERNLHRYAALEAAARYTSSYFESIGSFIRILRVWLGCARPGRAPGAAHNLRRGPTLVVTPC